MINRVLILLFFFSSIVFAQQENIETEVYLIDSYVTPKAPHEIVISFFTSSKVKSKIIFDEKFEFVISNKYVEDHKFELDLKKLEYDSPVMLFEIEVEDSSGIKNVSEKYELFLSEEYDLQLKDKSYLTKMCIGAFTYLIPSPTLAIVEGTTYFSLTKEIPILSFYDAGYNYPSSYLGFEYSYVFNMQNQNFLRIGYKHIFRIDYIKYISLGINGTTNFSGFNGVSPEVAFGLFKLSEVFTLYARYRFNLKLDNSFENFHEISVGLFTSVISFNY